MIGCSDLFYYFAVNTESKNATNYRLKNQIEKAEKFQPFFSKSSLNNFTGNYNRNAYTKIYYLLISSNIKTSCTPIVAFNGSLVSPLLAFFHKSRS